MSDIIKKAEADAGAAVKAAEIGARAEVAAGLGAAGRYANQATIGAQQAEVQTQGFLRRNVFAVVSIAVVLLAVAAFAVLHG